MAKSKVFWDSVALFIVWLTIMWTVDSAIAMNLNFNPATDVDVGIRNATVSFTTDENVTSRINYAPELPLSSNKISNEPKDSHEFLLTGLMPNRKHVFEIVLSNGTASARFPSEVDKYFEFTTLPAPDTTPPSVVVALSIQEVKAREITITWDKNPTDTDVAGYNVYVDTELVKANLTDKKYTVTGLIGSTKYTIKVNAFDTSGNQGAPAQVQMTTKQDTERDMVISDVDADVLGTTAIVSWNTNFPSHSRVEYGKTGLLLEQRQESPGMVTSHNVTMGNLEKDQNYTYKVVSCDEFNNCGSSPEFGFETVERQELFLEIDQFECGETKPYLHNSNQLDISGKTIGKADVSAFINGAEKRFRRTGADGVFVFNAVDLDPNNPQNVVKVVANDRVGKTVECTRAIRLDYVGPEVTFGNVSSFTTQSSVEISGTVSDDSDMVVKIYLTSGSDNVAPSKVENLTEDSVAASAVKLKWSKSDADDFEHFLIYRDDVTAGAIDFTKETSWTDDQVSPGAVYTYYITATDRAGNEGQRSDGYRVRIPGPAGDVNLSKVAPALSQAVTGKAVVGAGKGMAGGSVVGGGAGVTGYAVKQREAKEDIPNPAVVVDQTIAATGGSNTSVPFKYTVQPLFEGNNNIRVVFTDEAKNEFEQSFSVLKDSKPPKIISPTSAQMKELYDPSYVSEIEISGQVDDSNSTVFVYVNPTGDGGEAQSSTRVGPNGTFTVTVKLQRQSAATVQAGGSSETVTLNTETGLSSDAPPPAGTPAPSQSSAYGGVVSSGSFVNKVRLVAVDAAQQKSDPVEADIALTACGEGNVIYTKITIPSSILNSREIIQGLASFGLSYDNEWQGGGNCDKCMQKPRVVSAPLSGKEAKKYDNDWVQLPATVTTTADNKKGFILLNIITPKDIPGATMYEKETWISDHRKDECWPGDAFGCIHLLLLMEQPYVNPAPITAPPGGTGTIATPQALAPTMQKKCIDVKIQIDRRLDPSLIPKGFLTTMIDAINATLNFIDMIYGPIKTITMITIGLCLLTWIAQFFVVINKQFQCKFASVSGGSASITDFIKTLRQRMDIEKIAKFGGCEAEFTAPEGASDEQKQGYEALKSACEKCTSAIQTSRDVKYAYHFVCDRVMCPKVPTLQYYIKQHYRGGQRSTTLIDQTCPTGPQDFWTGEVACVCKKGSTAPAAQTPAQNQNQQGGQNQQPGQNTNQGMASPSQPLVQTDAVLDVNDDGITGYQTLATAPAGAGEAQQSIQSGQQAAQSAGGNRCTKGERCDAATGKCIPAPDCNSISGTRTGPCKCGTNVCMSKSQSCVAAEGGMMRCTNVRGDGTVPGCVVNQVAQSGGCYCGTGTRKCEQGQTCVMVNGAYQCSKDPKGGLPSCAVNQQLSADCMCVNVVCGSGQYCLSGRQTGCSNDAPTGAAVLSLDDENVIAEVGVGVSDTEESTPNLITGADTVTTVTTTNTGGTTTTTVTTAGGNQQSGQPGATDSSRRTDNTIVKPWYYTFREYEKNKYDYKTPAHMQDVQSDCELVDTGRMPIGQMFRAYEGYPSDSRFPLAEDENSPTAYEQLKEKCDKPHPYQAACCPFEYMWEWGWGVFFMDEVKFSYCLSNPDDDEHCGFGQSVVRGITGICDPQSGKRSTFIELDGAQYKKDYPNYDAYNGAVVYYIDLDESGSAKTVRRGYNGRATSTSTGGQGFALAEGNIARDGTIAFIPIDYAQNFANDFPKRDNSNLDKDQDMVSNLPSTEWYNDLCNDINSQNIVSRTNQPLTCDRAKMENWWRQIGGMMGDPGRQWIARPAGSMIQSLLTLCLTGILSWLGQFRNMLRLLMLCFQTILITGDGSSGQCQAIISQYICDIIYEVISCFISRMGGPEGATAGEGGISGFFGAVSAAGREVDSEAKSRYGDTNFFTEQFTTEKLVHDVCIFAFTGEWPTDWGALIEAQTTIPVQSTAMVFPVTRRFQWYDANTGHAKYVYRIGYSIFAGADINFRVKLVCTPGNCPAGKDGKCDCGHANPASYFAQGVGPFTGDVFSVNLPVHVDEASGNCPANGVLKQGQTCSEDLLLNLANMATPVRFDTAVVEWTYVGKQGGGSVQKGGFGGGGSSSGNYYSQNVADPDALSGFSQTSVNEVSGPPMGFCDFDLGRLSFLCGFDIPQSGIARFVGEPKLLSEDNFGPGDSEIAEMKIEVRQPKDASSCVLDCNYTKYLVLTKVTNGKGVTVYPKNPSVPLAFVRLNENRVKDYVFFDSDDLADIAGVWGEFVIKEEDFGRAPAAGAAGGASNFCQIQGMMPHVGEADCTGMPASTMKAAIEVTDKGGTVRVEDAFVYKVCELQGASGGCTPQGDERKCSFSNQAVPQGNSATSGANEQFKVDCGGMAFFVAKTYVDDVDGRRKQPNKLRIILDRPADAPSASSQAACTDEVEKWKAEFEIRDAVDAGGGNFEVSRGPSVDAQTSLPQKKVIEFPVQCKGGGAGRTSRNSIADIASGRIASVRVTSEHTKSNPNYGMYTCADSECSASALAPGEEIVVNGFIWVDSLKHEQGFTVSITSSSNIDVPLYIDIAPLELEATPDFSVAKNQDKLPLCGNAPCVNQVPSTRNNVVVIKVLAGDPQFKFTGFKSIVDDFTRYTGDRSFTLTRQQPSDKKVKLTPQAGSEQIFVKLSHYVGIPDGFDMVYESDLAALFEPFMISFDVKGALNVDPKGALIYIAGQRVPMCDNASRPSSGAPAPRSEAKIVGSNGVDGESVTLRCPTPNSCSWAKSNNQSAAGVVIHLIAFTAAPQLQGKYCKTNSEGRVVNPGEHCKSTYNDAKTVTVTGSAFSIMSAEEYDNLLTGLVVGSQNRTNTSGSQPSSSSGGTGSMPAGTNRCYGVTATEVYLKSLGAATPGETIEVRNLSGIAEAERRRAIADIGSGCIELISDSPRMNDIAAGDLVDIEVGTPDRLSAGRKIKICKYRAAPDGFLIDMEYEFTPGVAGTDPDPTIMLQMNLLTSDWDPNGANIDIAGYGSLPDCFNSNPDEGQSSVRPPQCVMERDHQSVLLHLKPFGTNTFRFRGLKSERNNPCNNLAIGAPCPNTVHTVCASIPEGSVAKCYSECFVQNFASVNSTNQKESNFCIAPPNDKCLRRERGPEIPLGELAGDNCPQPNLRCCATGVKKTVPQRLPGGGGRPAATTPSGAHINSYRNCNSDSDCTAPEKCDSMKMCSVPAAAGTPGAACSASTPCGGSLGCVGGYCMPTASAGSVGDGGVCSQNFECGSGANCVNSICQFSYIPVGGSCPFGAFPCADGAICYSPVGQCRDKEQLIATQCPNTGDLGEECCSITGMGSFCKIGMCTGGTCKPGAGSSCSSSSDCGGGLRCRIANYAWTCSSLPCDPEVICK
jgi:fibronectin type 3 domain-containing protein